MLVHRYIFLTCQSSGSIQGPLGSELGVLTIVYHGDLNQEALNQRTYHADNFVLAPLVVVITHESKTKMLRYIILERS
jgi:hypothetical protein